MSESFQKRPVRLFSWLLSNWQTDETPMRWRRPALIAAAITLVLTTAGVVFDRYRSDVYQADLRVATERTVNILIQRMKSRLQGDRLIADHLANLLAHAPNVTPGQLDEDVRRVLADNPHTLAVALAPDRKLGRVILREGARTDPAGSFTRLDLSTLAARLKDPGAGGQMLAVSGAGDQTLTLVVPVERNGQPWGALALIIDQRQFFAEAGIDAETSSVSFRDMLADDWLHVAVRHVDPGGETLLTGQPDIAGLEPVASALPVNGGRWEVMAAPRQGWDASPADQVSFRWLLAAAGLGMILPVFFASLLIGERNRHIAILKSREANLVELSQRFNLAMETSSIGIWEVTGDNHLTWDQRAAALHERPDAQDRSRLEEWLRTIHPDDVDAAEAHFFTCICSTTPCTQVYRIRLADGSLRHLRSAGASYRHADGSTRTTGIVWDVTSDILMNQTLVSAKENSDIKNAELELALDELSNREHQLEELSTRLDLALGSYNCGIWESNPHTRTEIWDRRMCQLYGLPYTDGHITAEQWMNLIHPDDRKLARRMSSHFPAKPSGQPLVVRVPQPDGSIRFVRSIGKPYTQRDGSQKLVGIAFDVTEDMLMQERLKTAKLEADAKNVELELARRRIEHNALHDPLTGLANRRKLDLELDALSLESRQKRRQVSLLHLDLDRFKQINDTLGHAAGDAMLVHAAQILTRNVGPRDLVARIGGDEFVILVNDNADPKDMATLAGRIVTELRQPIDFEGFSCRCGVSIGIAQERGVRIDARKMLINADIALYRAKGQGRNRFEFFTQNLQAEIIRHKQTADEILAGIEDHQFTAWYQPQFCAITRQLAGVEALIRWNHPQRGVLPPDAFLAIAEDLNVAATLDQIVLENVLKDQMRWAAAGIRIPRVSVNVSSRRLSDRTLIDTLQTLPISPGQIAFELVESIFLDDREDLVTENLERIKALGVDIEIDDFGTGHTSIVSLLKLKPRRLKIDRQLVMPILTAPQERALVRSIIEIARSLGVDTLAEGVETLEHATLLREMGCDLLQGFAFAKALPYADFTEAARNGFSRIA
ncbi:diguanylate cyclase (GGDEF) domain-containing protein [Rhizobium sp. RU35A]|uniref:bifunctional diguanylate cyclase/phosphodiesterase n=1 Tax=Rhizobium sp. RU35A TaxID=1907414 RepID=UPI0009553B54|nr:EAL domain-containing protein [Rhizobium sp. RU35A]SIP97833.1 diguanylate cyclase (GGDEF) domain-containing protein [Rhizobium sp. RU35A]